jgi:UDP-glucose 4-epimerase
MSTLAGKAALVTGVTGFLGVATARRLRAAGVEVHGVFRQAPPPSGLCASGWRADLTDPAAVRRVMDAVRPDLVFHLAGLTSAARDLALILPMLQVNLLAAVNVMVAATERGATRLVLAGSLEEPLPEAGWPVPCSPYAAAKLAAGAYARLCHALYGTPAVWLRLFMTYGPGQREVRRLVPYVILSLLRGEPPALSSGSRPVDWIYIDDVTDALLAAAVAKDVEGRTLDVGSGRLVTVREVVERIVPLVDLHLVPRFGAIPDRPRERVCVADVAMAEASLGWRARTSLDDGLRQTVDWYRQRQRERGWIHSDAAEAWRDGVGGREG